MKNPSHVILYVDDPSVSADFYAGLLGESPAEVSPNFVAFRLGPDLMLGLLSRHTAEPPPGAAGGGTEIAFSVAADERVDSLYADWRDRGLTIAQQPVLAHFAYTFVAQDPDGHRLRILAPRPAK